MLSRRDFIKFMSLFGGVVLNPFQWIVNGLGIISDVSKDVSAGELYEGFVLLPEGAYVPDFVIPRKLPRTKNCGLVEKLDMELHDTVIKYIMENH